MTNKKIKIFDGKTMWEEHEEQRKIYEKATVKKRANIECRKVLARIRRLKVLNSREVEKLNFKEIAVQYGITRQRAQQIYKEALKQIKDDKLKELWKTKK